MRSARWLRLVCLLGWALLACGAEEGGGAAPAPGGDGAVQVVRLKAPDFSLLDLQGKLVRLADLRGKTVVIDFWATWCPPCVFQVPELNAFWGAHREAGDVVLLGIAVDAEGLKVVEPWAREYDIQYRVLLGDVNLSRSYGVIGFPTLVVVTPDGEVDSVHVGLIEIEELEKAIAPLRAAGSPT